MSRKTFLSSSTNPNLEPTTLFVHVTETPEGGAFVECGCHSRIDDELVVLMTHEGESFEKECQEWQKWEESR